MGKGHETMVISRYTDAKGDVVEACLFEVHDWDKIRKFTFAEIFQNIP